MRGKETQNSRKRPEQIAVKIVLALAALVLAFTIPFPGTGIEGMEVSASFNAALLATKDPYAMIKNEDREVAYVFLMEHIHSLEALYDISPEAHKRMDDVFRQANVFIANNDMTVSQLVAYVDETEADLSAAARMNIDGAEQFLFLNNTVAIPSGKYNEPVRVMLSVVNLGKAAVTDVVITPTQDTDPKKWPFVIQTATDTRMIKCISAASSVEEGYRLHQDVAWDFIISNDAYTGTYPIKFHAIYYRNGEIEETDLVTYVTVTGRPGRQLIEEEKKQETDTLPPSTPRIIVTGFVTDPAVVYAGDTFHLTITVQNTSTSSTVSNVQFDLKAATEGENKETMYEAFLPTSGSASIFVNKIAPGETKDLNIEMTARSDLAQKPYVIDLKANYEDAKHNPFSATTSVSIPVKQEARVDYGDAEVLPESIEVGNQSNVMFPVYNKGKTTLYNVQVDFVGDSIEGGSTFLGKLEPGATGNVDAMINGIAPTEDDGTIRAVISYEDEAGNVTTLEKEITLFVYEMTYEEGDWGDMGDFGGKDMPEEKAFPWGPVIGGGVGGLIVLIIIISAIASSAKKKKARQQELDDLDD